MQRAGGRGVGLFSGGEGDGVEMVAVGIFKVKRLVVWWTCMQMLWREHAPVRRRIAPAARAPGAAARPVAPPGPPAAPPRSAARAALRHPPPRPWIGWVDVREIKSRFEIGNATQRHATNAAACCTDVLMDWMLPSSCANIFSPSSCAIAWRTATYSRSISGVTLLVSAVGCTGCTLCTGGYADDWATCGNIGCAVLYGGGALGFCC